MARSRWGGYFKGFSKYRDLWDTFKTEEATTVEAPTAPTEFDYTTAQGIWNLNSTIQFSGASGGVSTPAYSTGFSDSLDTISGELDGWRQRTVDISAYAGATVRLVFHYTNGSSYLGDIQLDAINLDGNSYSFENSGESFERSSGGETTYAGVSWQALAVGTTTGKWNVDAGGTGSGGTARSDAADGSYYVYAETSSPANVSGYNFWLRSPQVTLGSTPTLTYYETRLGSGIGTLNVHLDVIA